MRSLDGALHCIAEHAHTAQGADCVWHIAALVGPYYEHKAYYDVNYLCAPACRLSAPPPLRSCFSCVRISLAAGRLALQRPARKRLPLVLHACGFRQRCSAALAPALGARSPDLRAEHLLPPYAPCCGARRGTLNVIEACKRLKVRHGSRRYAAP